MTPDLERGTVARALAFLEEERRRDRAELDTLHQRFESIAESARSHTNRLDQLDVELRSLRSQTARISDLEGQIRQTAHPITLLEQRLNERERHWSQLEQARALELERDRRATAEVQVRVVEAAREVEQLRDRIALVSEEIKRERSLLPEVTSALESVGRQIEQLAGRLRLVEEVARRVESLHSQLEHRELKLETEQNRIVQVLQLSEVRLTRQIADWQQSLDEWGSGIQRFEHTVVDYGRRLIGEQEQRAELQRQMFVRDAELASHGEALGQLDAARTVTLDEIVHLQKLVEAARRRTDDQAGELRAFEERVGRIELRTDEGDRRLIELRERIEAQASWLSRLERQVMSAGEDFEAIRVEMAQHRYDAEKRDETIRLELDSAARRVQTRLEELERLQEQHRQRQIAELEMQVRELKGIK